MGYRGLSITIPHKVEAMQAVDQVHPTAQAIGCINTVVNDDGHLTGYNSDGLGALGALRSAGADPLEQNTLILGSGGAARAIAITLAREAAPKQMTILGVEADQLEQLVQDVDRLGPTNVVGGELTDQRLTTALEETDILLHCSPIGMHPNVEQSLVPAAQLREELTVFDVVYNPRRTRLIQDAHQAGCRTVLGLQMFLGQAFVQFELWTGKKAPRDVMREVVESRL